MFLYLHFGRFFFFLIFFYFSCVGVVVFILYTLGCYFDASFIYILLYTCKKKNKNKKQNRLDPCGQ